MAIISSKALISERKDNLQFTSDDGNIQKIELEEGLVEQSQKSVGVITKTQYPWDGYNWEIHLTGKIVLIYSPRISKIFGKPAVKDGKSTWGYIDFKDITMIWVTKDIEHANFLSIQIYSNVTRFDYVVTNLMFSSSDNLRTLLTAFIETYKISCPNSSFSPLLADACNKTIDNFKNAVLDALPNTKNLVLELSGAVPRIYNSKDGVNPKMTGVNTTLTEVKTYDESGVAWR